MFAAIAVTIYTLLAIFGTVTSVYGLYKNDWKPVLGARVEYPGLTLLFTGLFAVLIHGMLFLALGPVWPVFAGMGWTLVSLMLIAYQYMEYGRTRTAVSGLSVSLMVTLFILIGYWSFV